MFSIVKIRCREYLAYAGFFSLLFSMAAGVYPAWRRLSDTHAKGALFDRPCHRIGRDNAFTGGQAPYQPFYP